MKMFHAFIALGLLTALMLILSVVSYNLDRVPDGVALSMLITSLTSFMLIWAMLLVSSFSKNKP
jgi:hypothetical protein